MRTAVSFLAERALCGGWESNAGLAVLAASVGANAIRRAGCREGWRVGRNDINNAKHVRRGKTRTACYSPGRTARTAHLGAWCGVGNTTVYLKMHDLAVVAYVIGWITGCPHEETTHLHATSTDGENIGCGR